MSETATTTTSIPEVFHPDALAALAALAAGSGDQPAWHERALCAQTDPEAFFPEKGSSTRDAKQICNRCPVRAECLEDALRRDERFGVWGAKSETERRALRRARPAPTELTRAAAGATVPEQRASRSHRGRESVPPPGRRPGSAAAGTLPTEARGHRDLPTRPASTFPARARVASPAADGGPARTRRSSSPSTSRRRQGTPVTPAARAGRPRSAPTAPADPNGITASSAAKKTSTDAGGEPTPGDEAAGAGSAVPDQPPREVPQGERDPDLVNVARLVLTGQHRQDDPDPTTSLGLEEADLSRVLDLVAAMVNGLAIRPPRTRVALWERRIAAVTAVLSGTLTRGQTGRAIDERSQDIAHWCRRHLETMALLDVDEHPERDQTAASVRRRAGVQRWRPR